MKQLTPLEVLLGYVGTRLYDNVIISRGLIRQTDTGAVAYLLLDGTEFPERYERSPAGYPELCLSKQGRKDAGPDGQGMMLWLTCDRKLRPHPLHENDWNYRPEHQGGTI